MTTPRLHACGRVGWLALAAAASVASGCSNKTDDRDVLNNSISITELSRQVNKPDPGILLIDARTASQYSEGHIPGARNIRLDQIDAKERDPALEKYKTIIVYGQTPGPTIALSTAKRLIQAGYEDVRWFGDGFQSWVSAGLPVAKPGTGIGEPRKK